MDNFDLKKYLAEGKLLKEEPEVGNTIEIDPSAFPNFEFPYGTRGEIFDIDKADYASDDLVYTVKLKHIDSQGTTNDTLHIENPNQYLDESKLLKEGITSETDKVASEFRKELVDMKKHFGSRLKDNTIYWGGYKKIMKASEGSEGYAPSRDGIIPMYLYWMSRYRADKSGKYVKLAQEIEKEGIKLEPLSDYRDGTDNYRIVVK